MLRVAIIGCGSHARIAHGPALARLAAERRGDLELSAACDLDLGRAEKFAADFGFARPYTEWRDMLSREKPDGCIAIMPVPLIAALAEELLQRPIPCVIEKPMGASLDEVRHLCDVAQSTGTPHMVSVNRRFLPALSQALTWTRARGPLRFVRAAMLRVRRQEPDFAWGTGMHLVDALRHIAGEVADFRFAVPPEPAAAAWYSAEIRFASGAIGHLEILPTAGIEEEAYEVMGEGFRAQIVSRQDGATALRCWHNGKLEIDDASAAAEPAFVSRGEYGETAEFLNALRDGRCPRPNLMDVLPSACLCAQLMGWR